MLNYNTTILLAISILLLLLTILATYVSERMFAKPEVEQTKCRNICRSDMYLDKCNNKEYNNVKL